MIGEWLHPPGSPLGIKNDLLPGPSADYASFDSVDPVGTALRRGREPGEFDSWSWNAVLSEATAIQKDANDEEKSPLSSETVCSCTRGSLPLPTIETTKANSLAAGVETGQLYPRRCGTFRPLTLWNAPISWDLLHRTTKTLHLPAFQE